MVRSEVGAWAYGDIPMYPNGFRCYEMTRMSEVCSIILCGAIINEHVLFLLAFCTPGGPKLELHLETRFLYYATLVPPDRAFRLGESTVNIHGMLESFTFD